MIDKTIREWKKAFPKEFLQTERIVTTAGIIGGMPRIKDTRIPVVTVLNALAGDGSIESVLDNYPTLTREDVLAAVAYGALQVEALTNHIIGSDDDLFAELPIMASDIGGDVS
jgi:uncharacterized protein (DUF433 family)